jgi:hypothetical protein
VDIIPSGHGFLLSSRWRDKKTVDIFLPGFGFCGINIYYME